MTAPARVPSIVIVGGGFSGAAVALHLLRDEPGVRARINIVGPAPQLGAGLAYGTPDPQHRINVAAARMAVFADDPRHLDGWLHADGDPARDPDSVGPTGDLFPRRATFGRYVGMLLWQAAEGAFEATVRHVRARVLAASAVADGYALELSDGDVVHADMLVLATGHPPASVPAALASLQGTDYLIADPWRGERLRRIASDARILIVGTGLTMLDVVASLRAGGHRGPIIAVSRRGLLPRARTAIPVQPTGRFAPPPARGIVPLLREVRAAIKERRAAGRPWEDVFDALRAQAQDIWAALPRAERARFLRHLAPFWDVHRYQCAPQIHALLQRELRAGTLAVRRGRLLGAAGDGGCAQVRLCGAGGQDEAVACDVVINCTGPDHRRAVASNPVLASLASAGVIQPDPLGMGLLTDRPGYAVDAIGRVRRTLLVAGPPARGAFGELMGLPQVSDQPRAVAAEIAAMLRATAFPAFLPTREEVQA